MEKADEEQAIADRGRASDEASSHEDRAEEEESASYHCSKCGSLLSHHHHHRPALQVLGKSTSRRSPSLVSSLRSRTRRAAEEGFNHPLSRHQTGKDVIVDFDGPDDPYNPLNWPFRQKLRTTAIYSLVTMSITFASSVYSPAIPHISHEFGIGSVTSSVGLSLLLFGFGLGPLIWGPLSELYGRKMTILGPLFLAGVFVFATGVAKDVQTIMISRFFTGFFGAAPVGTVSATSGDIWRPAHRGVASAISSMAIVGGPTLGPLVGGAITTSSLSWRWTQYVTGILIMVLFAAGVLFVDESYPPALLTYKARRLRHETNNWALHAKHEEWDFSIAELGKKYLVRPFQMLLTPICFHFALYASFVYGILYANLSAFAVEYEQVRGWNQVVGALPFIALLLGMGLGCCVILANQSYYGKKLRANDNRPVPEARLPPMMVGSIAFSGGLFIFAWTSDPSISWVGSVIGCGLIGFGFFTIFSAAIAYLIDTFRVYSASALAANTFLRSCFAGAFPIFTLPMYHNIGVDWGSTIFACISVAMIPIPFLFFVYGERIRNRGYWSREGK